MKLSFMFVLHIVLIYSSIVCLNVVSEEIPEISIDDASACITPYLKSKGKLENEFQLVKTSCRLTVRQIVDGLKRIIIDKLKETLPNEMNCIMEQIDKHEIMDIILKIAVIELSDSLTETEINTQLQGPQDELKIQLKASATSCGLADDKLVLFFRGFLGKKSKSLVFN